MKNLIKNYIHIFTTKIFAKACSYFSLLLIFTLASCTNKSSESKRNTEKQVTNNTKTQTPIKNTSAKKLPEGCPPKLVTAFYGQSQIGQIHKLSGEAEIWVCGAGSLDNFTGQVFHKNTGKDEVVEVGTFGGMRQAWGPLSVDKVKVELQKNSFKITQLTPYRDDQPKPLTTITFECDESQCTKLSKLDCAWKATKIKPQGSSIKTINKFLAGSSDTLPSNKNILETYFDALDSHKDSLKFFKANKAVPAKIKNNMEDYGGQDTTFDILKKYLTECF